MIESTGVSIESWTTHQLADAAAAGNDEAFQLFFVRSQRKLRRVLKAEFRSYGLPTDQVDDLAQETFVKAWAYRRKRAASGSTPSPICFAWLVRIAERLILDRLRRDRVFQKALAVYYGQRSTELAASFANQRDELAEYTPSLPPRERELLTLVLENGLHPQKAGSRLGLSSAASYKAYRRGVRHYMEFAERHGSLPKAA